MTSTLKNLFILLALMLTIGLGYYVYVGNPELQDSSNMGEAALIDAKAARFLARLNDIKQIELKSDILSDMRFGSLSSFVDEIEQEPVGRDNPFENN